MPFNRKKNLFNIFLITSILIHFVLFLLLQLGAKDIFNREMADPKPVFVQLKQLKQEPLPIVDIPEPKKEEQPDKASAEALYSQKVQQETVATSTPSSQPNQPTPPVPPQEKPVEKQETQKELTPKELYAMRTPKKIEDQQFRMPGIPEAPLSPQAQGSSGEFLPNYKIGNRTYINTDANLQIRYFVELKRKFKLTWNPFPSLRGQINQLSRGKVQVVLGVSVTPSGQLASLILIRSSGLEDFDYEGKRTVKDSAPFSSPPSDLIGEDGMLHMAWHFTVYL